MLTKRITINDEIVNVINTIFELVNDFKYEKAYIYFMDNTKTIQIDSVIKSGVRHPVNFTYTIKKRTL